MRHLTKIAALLALLSIGPVLAQDDLAAGFRNPPDSAKPHTWWHWMNGNVTKAGITADLEAMKRFGLGGAQIFNVGEAIPEGPVRFGSPEWLEMIKFAAQEADRLGLELCIHNCGGWSSSGGPWNTPEHAMQFVTTSETRVKGPAAFAQVLKQPQSRLGFYRDIAVLAFPTPRDDRTRIKEFQVKAGFESRYGQQPDLSPLPADCAIPRDKIVDLTAKMDADGKLTWDVPAGDWTILRIGHTPTGAGNHPAPAGGAGPECDKFSREALDAHWAGMMGKIIQNIGPLAGKSLNNVLIDSYEVGGQNWTERFRDEFKKRRGYDPLLFLPTMTGRVVDNGEVSERFLWDLRRTIGDLFADNYYGYFAELCKKNGMLASIEPYDGPFECLLSGKGADVPMGEFWIGGGESSSVKLAASVAHIYGRKLVGAESFTATPGPGRWQQDPFSLKMIGDLQECAGVNRFIVHRYAMQPWMDKFPGMTMGQWGTHFERTETWWEQGKAWAQYVTRSQYLLQQGLFVADVAYFAGEAAPNGFPHNGGLKSKGYDYDGINTDVIMNRMSVKDGRLVLADGMSYRVLVLPDTRFMTPELLAKLAELVQAGATIIGPKPERSPSFSGYPQCDEKVKQLADQVWGDCDGQAVKEHAYGKGKVVWGKPVEDVLAAMGAGPDFTAAGRGVRAAYIHRKAVFAGAAPANRDVDIYFVSNQRQATTQMDCSFRITGKVPELWHPDTGLIERAPVWTDHDGVTTVPLQFDPAGSVFVIFRKPAAGPHLVAAKAVSAQAAASSAPGKLEIRKATYEALDGAGSKDVTALLAGMARGGTLVVEATNDALGGDPTPLHLKRLRVRYALDGKENEVVVPENDTLEIPAGAGAMASGPAPFDLAVAADGSQILTAWQPCVVEVTPAAGKPKRVQVKAVPAPLEIAGPWRVQFPPKWGAPPEITLDKLASWTDNQDAGVRYFSGTGTYTKEIDVPKSLIGAGKVLVLDLGEVKNLAEVKLNGTDLGILWKPPFRVDITQAVRPGKNQLEVRITNLWVNRLIGDEQLPEDVEWRGKSIAKWPDWLLQNKPRTSGRFTFTTWHHWTKNDKPLESGLLGPVVVRVGQQVAVTGKLPK